MEMNGVINTTLLYFESIWVRISVHSFFVGLSIDQTIKHNSVKKISKKNKSSYQNRTDVIPIKMRDVLPLHQTYAYKYYNNKTQFSLGGTYPYIIFPRV